MPTSLIRFIVFIFFFGLVLACNIYTPLSGKNSTEDFLEEALKCLHEGDFGCAIENYKLLPDGDLKNQKLCTGYLAKSGFTINTLLNVVTQQSSTMLGSLAQALVPWNSTKESDGVEAKTSCQAYAASSASGDTGVLLKAMALFVDCSLRIAKTDQVVATSNSDTACNTPGNLDGKVTKADVADGAGGAIVAKGMCKADLDVCFQDVVGLDSGSLGNAGLGDIKGAFDKVPSEVKNDPKVSDIATNGVRAGIVATIPAN